MREAAAATRAAAPRLLATAARGSSRHAADVFGAAAWGVARIPVAPLSPAAATLYGHVPPLQGTICLAVSQSGQSPDLVETLSAAAAEGALTLALTNTPGSPLSSAAMHCIDIAAGEERSIAATKSYVASAAAGLWWLASTWGDRRLERALHALPAAAADAQALDWSRLEAALAACGPAAALYTIGRGPAEGLAGEAALKLKETCALQAEALSSAEVLHGPVCLVGPGFPVLALAVGDAAEAATAATADRLAELGARVFATTARARAATVLPRPSTGHPLTDLLALAVPLYGTLLHAAIARGGDPDRPHHLAKVTETR